MDKTIKGSMGFRLIRYVGERRLRALLSFFFLRQCVLALFAEFPWWGGQANDLVNWSLLIVLVMEMLPMVNAWLLRCAQMVLLLLIVIAASNYRPVWFALDTLDDWGNLVYENFWQLHPLIWFALGSWIAFLFFNWWMKARWRAGLATLGTVLVLAIWDAAGSGDLWQEAVLVVLCGLLLIIISQLARIRRRNPAAWAGIMEQPSALLLTLGILAVAVVVPGFLMPAVQPLIPERQLVYKYSEDGSAPAYGQISPLREEKEDGETNSGYNRQDDQLGGDFETDDTPVFRVTSTQQSYWRGETLSYYTGEGWEKSAVDLQANLIPIVPGGQLAGDPRFHTELLQTAAVRQTFQMLEANEAYSVLFGAYPMGRIVSLEDGTEAWDEGRLHWSARQGEVRWSSSPGGTAYPQSYTVESEVPVVDPEGLKKASPPAQPADFSEYLQLPETIPERVRLLAEELAAQSASAYETAEKLRQYLRVTYPYTTRPQSAAEGGSGDFVDAFLFEIKEGYSDYYSTAMAVLSRAAGIPSRWVKGYATGELSSATLGSASEPAVFTVTRSDAHSWTELYFEGYGWIPFEATAGFEMPLFLRQNAVEDEDGLAVELLEETQARQEPAGWNKGRVAVAVIGGAGILVLLLAAWLLRRRMAEAFPLLSLRRREKEPRRQVAAEYHRFVRLLKKAGTRPEQNETAREVIERLESGGTSLFGPAAQELLELFERAQYSDRQVTAEEGARAVSIVNEMKKRMQQIHRSRRGSIWTDSGKTEDIPGKG
ncbi:MAG: hypothetical protein K0R57_1737 [Paenibacillaceae bacterium]|jgi:transglutaminase-like putative cysteine protease|nr:hypothetical protein [Paenibacillaceae bacterium]